MEKKKDQLQWKDIRKDIKELQELTGELTTKLREIKGELQSQSASVNESVNHVKEDIVQSNGEIRIAVVGMLDRISDLLVVIAEWLRF